MASVVIDIASEFTGKKAFKQADTATDKLSKSAKNLAKSIGLAFSTAAIIGYGRKSLKAALESQAQQQRLAKLMKVTVNASDAQIASLNAQAEALANVGVVTAGNITQTQSQLATFNLQADTIKTLTPAILDYVTAEKGAAASASEFKSMTNGLAQALNGNFASLTKTGFVLDDVTKKTIATGTESERAAALVAVLDSTYKDFNKSLRLAIDKANLALGKGEDIFDMDKIQLNAALIGQAEALGKATTGAQILAIANDIQRLKVKQDIAALEDAIASKDVARIEAATKQLNQDLKILGTLQSQNFTLLSIKTVLDSLKPKELIDQENLDAALAKIKAMMLLLAGGTATKGTTAGVTAGTGISGGGPLFDGQPVIGKLTGDESIGAILDYSEAVTALANVMAQIQEEQNYKDFLSLVDFQKKLGDFGGYSGYE
jgi:hypothetical protein